MWQLTRKKQKSLAAQQLHAVAVALFLRIVLQGFSAMYDY